MAPSAKESYGLSRRQVVQMLGAAVAAGFLPGCGGGGGSAPQTRVVAGTANLPGVSPETLLIQSVHSPDVPVGADGSFTATVSDVRAQLLLATDTDGQLRGLSVSVPGPGTRGPGDFSVDTSSTALAVVMMTPGILTTDKDAAGERALEIASSSSFSQLVSYLDAELATKTLAEVAGQAEYGAKVQACVDEWLTLHLPPRAVDLGGTRYGTWLSVDAKFGPQNHVHRLAMHNSAFRIADVWRRDYAADGTIVNTVHSAPHLLDGGEPLGWTSLFDGEAFSPTREVDLIPIDFGTATRSEYWFWGPGFFGEAPPSGIAPRHAEAIGKSILAYALVPLIEFLADAVLEVTGGLLDALWDLLQTADDVFELIEDFSVGRLVQALVAVMSLGAALAPVLVSAGLLPAVALKVGLLLLILGGAFVFANMMIAHGYWTTLPAIHHIDVTAHGDGTIVIG
jgi:hypothetical protein